MNKMNQAAEKSPPPKGAYPIPVVYPQDEVLCVMAYADGISGDDPKTQLHAHAVVADWLQGQVKTPMRVPRMMGKSDFVAQLTAVHESHKEGGGDQEGMGAINWLALAQQILQMALAIIQSMMTPPK